MDNSWLTFLKDVGFPILVAIWLLTDLKSTLRSLKMAVDRNTNVTLLLATKVSQQGTDCSKEEEMLLEKEKVNA